MERSYGVWPTHNIPGHLRARNLQAQRLSLIRGETTGNVIALPRRLLES